MILFHCIYMLAKIGRGTLSPADPTKKLVITGLYRYSRNPMYVGVILILFGEAVIMQSIVLGIYLLLIFLLFNLFIIFHEEPRLHRAFGSEYFEYKKSVSRWIIPQPLTPG